MNRPFSGKSRSRSYYTETISTKKKSDFFRRLVIRSQREREMSSCLTSLSKQENKIAHDINVHVLCSQILIFITEKNFFNFSPNSHKGVLYANQTNLIIFMVPVESTAFLLVTSLCSVEISFVYEFVTQYNSADS